jgi:hypothetical protein
MEIIKKSVFALVLLLVVVLVWVGLYIYFESSKIDINPNAETYTVQLADSFDLDELEKVADRTQKHFPVPPRVFFSLEGRD